MDSNAVLAYLYITDQLNEKQLDHYLQLLDKDPNSIVVLEEMSKILLTKKVPDFDAEKALSLFKHKAGKKPA